jgi:hypothetical protein
VHLEKYTTVAEPILLLGPNITWSVGHNS